MELKYKPDFDYAKEMWNHYWAKEVLKRPLVVANVVKQEGKTVDKDKYKYYNACTKNYREQLTIIDEWLDNTLFLAESIPCFSPSHGPDQFAAMLGADLKFSESSKTTNWVEPIVENWEEFIPKIKLNENNSVWQSLLEYSKILKEHSKGKYLVGICDFYSNADMLSAIRSPAKLCMDFYDYPESIAKAMLSVRKLYKTVYNSLYEAGGMNNETGTIGWIPFWCKDKYATIQCDFICMVSPKIANEYIIPALEEEANFLDHCIYHLDGPGALPHLDNILAIKKIDAIQWIPGDGQPPQYEWIDVLKKCQKAGKGLQILDVTSIDIIKKFSKELSPEGLVYCIDVKTEREVDEITTWLEKNT